MPEAAEPLAFRLNEPNFEPGVATALFYQLAHLVFLPWLWALALVSRGLRWGRALVGLAPEPDPHVGSTPHLRVRQVNSARSGEGGRTEILEVGPGPEEVHTTFVLIPGEWRGDVWGRGLFAQRGTVAAVF